MGSPSALERISAGHERIEKKARCIGGRATSGQIVSHAFRAANGTSVFMAVPWTRDAQESLDDLRRTIGETHKFVKAGP